MTKTTLTFITEPSKDYELIDSGLGEKLERFGQVLLSRPDPQALWKKGLPAGEWLKAAASFETEKFEAGRYLKYKNSRPKNSESKDPESKSGWRFAAGTPRSWPIELAGLKFLIKPAAFKHVGLFPEQSAQWQWIKAVIAKGVINHRQAGGESGAPVSVLNLFGYTGAASLAAAAAGASVTHVDASKPSVTWAKENAALSGLSQKPIRWIVDDVPAFVKREGRRGNRYDAIIMDPPAFGRGPKGQVWKIEDELLGLLDDCKKILSPKPLFFLLNGYASGYSPVAYEQCLASVLNKKSADGAKNETLESGELAIRETSAGRLLPAGIFARWSAF
jgi:23S rRNA (cytosine1962-C5)-methyltransferase